MRGCCKVRIVGVGFKNRPAFSKLEGVSWKIPSFFLSSPEYLVVKNRAVLGWVRVSFLFRPNYPLSSERYWVVDVLNLAVKPFAENAVLLGSENPAAIVDIAAAENVEAVSESFFEIKNSRSSPPNPAPTTAILKRFKPSMSSPPSAKSSV